MLLGQGDNQLVVQVLLPSTLILAANTTQEQTATPRQSPANLLSPVNHSSQLTVVMTILPRLRIATECYCQTTALTVRDRDMDSVDFLVTTADLGTFHHVLVLDPGRTTEGLIPLTFPTQVKCLMRREA